MYLNCILSIPPLIATSVKTVRSARRSPPEGTVGTIPDIFIPEMVRRCGIRNGVLLGGTGPVAVGGGGFMSAGVTKSTLAAGKTDQTILFVR